MPRVFISINLIKENELSSFKKVETIELIAEFHPLQNILLISLESNYPKNVLEKIAITARNEAIAQYREKIVDEMLPFDIMVLERSGTIHRMSLSAVTAKSCDITICDEHMFAIKWDPNLAEDRREYGIHVLQCDEISILKSIRQLEGLLFGPMKDEILTAIRDHDEGSASEVMFHTDAGSKMNYPHFVHSWLKYFKDKDKSDAFLINLVAATSKLYITYSAESNIIGALGVSSTVDQKLHYLSFFVVDQKYRKHFLSTELLKAALSEIHEEVRHQAVFTFYTDQPFMLALLSRVGIDPDAARLQSSICDENIPIIETLQLRRYDPVT